MNQYLTDKQTEFTKIIQAFIADLSSFRTGRANPNVLDNVQVEAYGVRNNLSGVANINVIDGSLVITPWDKSLTKAVETGITAADLGFSVINEGERIRLQLPPLTEESRKELVKKLNVRLEKARVDLRTVRDQIKSNIEKSFAAKDVLEDDKFRFIKELDAEVGKLNDQLKEARDRKEKEIMTI